MQSSTVSSYSILNTRLARERLWTAPRDERNEQEGCFFRFSKCNIRFMRLGNGKRRVRGARRETLCHILYCHVQSKVRAANGGVGRKECIFLIDGHFIRQRAALLCCTIRKCVSGREEKP